MKDRNREIALMPEFDSEEAFDAYFAEKTAAVAPYRDRQGRLGLDDIHDLPEVVEKVFAGHPDSMTAGTVEDLVETVLYVARMYERSKCFERIYVNRIQMEKSEYDAILRHLNDPDSIDDEYRISDVVFAADNTTVSVLWEGNSKDGVSGTVTLAVNGKTVYATKSTKVFCNHWVIPYNGAEYHVLVDVLPKKTVLEETIYVSKPYAERIKKYLRGAEAQGDGSSLSKTAKFSDGFEMDIRCCGGKDDSWTEAILYDDTGREVAVTEPCDGFTGCWELKDEDANTVYRAHVMTKPNLN